VRDAIVLGNTLVHADGLFAPEVGVGIKNVDRWWAEFVCFCFIAQA